MPVRVRLGLRLGLGGGSPSRSVLAPSSLDTQKMKVFKTGSSATPPIINKKPPSNGDIPSLLMAAVEVTTLSSKNMGKFMLDFVSFCVY